MLDVAKLKRSLFAASLLAAVTIGGCGPGYGPVGVSLAVRSPPRDRVEVVTTSPGAGYVWVRGHYAWQGGDYAWVGGAWQQPPETRYRRWEPGHWQHARGGWFWVEGHWR